MLNCAFGFENISQFFRYTLLSFSVRPGMIAILSIIFRGDGTKSCEPHRFFSSRFALQPYPFLFTHFSFKGKNAVQPRRRSPWATSQYICLRNNMNKVASSLAMAWTQCTIVRWVAWRSDNSWTRFDFYPAPACTVKVLRPFSRFVSYRPWWCEIFVLEIRYSQSPSYWGAFCVYNLTSCTLLPYAYNEIPTFL